MRGEDKPWWNKKNYIFAPSKNKHPAEINYQSGFSIKKRCFDFQSDAPLFFRVKKNASRFSFAPPSRFGSNLCLANYLSDLICQFVLKK